MPHPFAIHWAGPAKRLRPALAACFLLAAAPLACRNSSEQAPAPSRGQAPAAVVTRQISETSLEVEATFIGEVVAEADAALKAEESGRVRRVLVVEGERVKRGQVLVELDDRLASAELARAEADVQRARLEEAQARVEAQRYQQLNEEQVVSDLDTTRELDEAERLKAQAHSAQATSLVQAERLRRLRIVAPFDGIIATRAVDPGDWLSSGQQALRLVGDKRTHILTRVTEATLAQLPKARSFALRAGDQTVAARLDGVVNALEPTTRTALLRLVPEASPEWLRPGSTVDVVIRLQQSGGVVVARDALVRGVSGVRVMQVVGGKATPIPVEVLISNATQALVRGALALGDEVVTKGNERLRPDQPVTSASSFGKGDGANAARVVPAESAPPGAGRGGAALPASDLSKKP